MSIQGTLEDMSMVELLQMPVRERRTGVLTITQDDQEAELVYQQGVLVYSRFGEYTGDEAVFEVIGWQEGSFALDFKEVEKPTNIKSKIENLIMEGVRRLDEKNRLRGNGAGGDGNDSRLQGYLDGLMAEDENLTFAGITNDACSNIVEKHERNELPVSLKQGIAIMLQLIRESASHVEDDPAEVFMTQSRSYSVFSQRLKQQRYLIVACGRDVPLGELMLRVRSAVEGINSLLHSDE